MLRNWFSMKAADESGSTVDVSIYDEIGFFGVSAKAFKAALDSFGDVKRINLSINSPGGEVFDGLAIYNMLARHPAKVVVTVDGLAASMASVIAMAGDKIVMPDNALMMIHNPSSGILSGTADDMRDLADLLDKLKGSLITVYEKRTGLSAEEISELMDAETWLTSLEAAALGFADATSDAVVAHCKFDVQSLAKYENQPDTLLDILIPIEDDEVESEEESEEESDEDESEFDENESDADPDEIEIDADALQDVFADLASRHAEIVARCVLAGFPEDAVKFIEDGASLEKVALVLAAKKANAEQETGVRHAGASPTLPEATWAKAIDRVNARNRN